MKAPAIGGAPGSLRSEGANWKARRILWLAGAALSGLACPAYAQDDTAQDGAAVASDGQDQRFGGTIIVTAERRETDLQETPLSIVAFDEAAIEAKGIEDLQDLSTFTPNLNITPGRGSGNSSPYFSIRGIAGGGGATGERGVGLYIDNIYVPRTNGTVLRVLDIDRVEVLRGPQGTLFGRNSTGGAVRIFSKQPRLGSTEGYLRVTAANIGRSDVVGAVNVPLGDDAAMRVQGAWLRQGGWVERGTQDLGESEDFIGRAQLRYEPTSDFEVTLGFLLSDSSTTSSPHVFEEFDMRPGIEGVWQGNYADWLNDAFKQDGQAPLAAYNDPRLVIDPFTAPSICLLDDFDPDFDEACEQFEDNTYWQADLRAVYDVSDTVRLSSTTGFSKLDHESNVDWQMIGTEDRHTIITSETFYQELQLNAELFGGAVDLVTGASYFHEKSFNDGEVNTRRGTSNFITQAPNGDTDAGIFHRDDIETTQTSDSIGLFASATWHLTDWIGFTGGLRYAHDSKDYRETEYPSVDFTPAPGTGSTTVTSDHTWEQIDWRGSLDFQLTDDWMWYFTASKAYKAGSFSGAGVISLVPGDEQSGDFITPIAPEKVINFESGTRLELFDGRVRFNPTAFYMLWSNRQAARQVSCDQTQPDCPIGFRIEVSDTGDVDIYGVELDAQIGITRDFWLDGSFGYTGYKLKDETANGGPNLFPGPPKYSYNIGATYMADLGVGELSFNLNYAYTGKQPTHPSAEGDSAYLLPPIELVNARIRFQPDNAPISVSVFANNLLDETYATYATRFGGGYWDRGGPPHILPPAARPPRSALSVVRGKPREVGVSIQYDF
jgi:iron complex outermembrane receptor protein